MGNIIHGVLLTIFKLIKLMLLYFELVMMMWYKLKPIISFQREWRDLQGRAGFDRSTS